MNDVTCLATTPPTISSKDTFGTFSKYGTLHVLPGCFIAYKAKKNWKNFTIVEDAEDPGLSGTCGPNLTWVLDTSTGLLRIMGTGAMYNYDSSSSPWYNYRSAIKIVEIADGVTSIGTEAFTDCSNLNDITCLATTPPIIYDTTFSTYAYNGTLHVLPECKAAYEAAEYWKDFFNIAEDAKETAIESLKAEPSVRSSEIFDLSGRKIQQGHKGIVIQNGKKILVK